MTIDLDTSRPFTRTEALRAGLTDAHLRGPRFQRLFRNVHLATGVTVTPALRVEAALRLHSGAAFASHASAARIHEVPLPTLADEHISVRRPRDRRTNPGVRCHVAPSASIAVVVKGLRVSPPEQMFVELATMLGLVDLVVVGDDLVRRGRTTMERLVEFCAGASLAGAVAARRAASLVRARVDSPMETRLRMLLVLAGLPEPLVNMSVTDRFGVPVRRFDLAYPTVKVVVEYDGRHHVERTAQWESDLTRREAIDEDGWRILVVTATGIYRQPGRTLERVHRLLLDRGLPGVRPCLDEAWRAHFPGQG